MKHSLAVNMNNQYRKKPVVVEAFQMTKERRRFNTEWPEWLHEAWNKSISDVGALIPAHYHFIDASEDALAITTLKGSHLVTWGDYVIQGVQGELYPCKPDIFEATYEPVKEAA